MSALRDTERRIGALLAQLERDTDSLVERIEICDLEVTSINDDRPQIARHVYVFLRRAPGSKWDT